VTRGLALLVTLIAWPVFKLLPWQTTYYRNLKRLPFWSLEAIIFDQLIPRIARYWNREEIQGLVAGLGGMVQCELVQGNSWHVRVEKPR
jgi:hypothetical protein